MTEEHTATTQSCIAGLAAADDSHLISGVAIGPGDVTNGLNGQKYWPAAELEAAAETFEGTPLKVDHSDSARDVVGEVVRAAYEEDVGVVYEAELDDEELAEKIERGRLEVSLEATHANGGEHEETGAMLVKDPRFTALAIVPNGAAPSNTAEAGPAQALAAELSAEDIHDLLAELKTVDGVTFQGTKSGELDKSEIPTDDYASHYIFDGRTKTASSYPVVDAEGNLRRGNVQSAWTLRGHARNEEKLVDVLLDLNDEFDDPPIDEEDAEAAAAIGAMERDEFLAHLEAAGFDVPETDDAPTASSAEDLGGSGDAAHRETTNDSHTSMSNEDDLEETVQELKAKLADKQGQIDELETEVAQLREERDDVAEAYAAALATEDSPFSAADYADKFTVAELRERFEEREEATLTPDVQSGGGDDSPGEEAALSDEDREQKALLEARIEKYEGAGWDAAAEQAREELDALADE